MARSTEFIRTLRSQLHKWGFAPMTSPEEDAILARAQRDGAAPRFAAAAIANARIDKFNLRDRS